LWCTTRELAAASPTSLGRVAACTAIISHGAAKNEKCCNCTAAAARATATAKQLTTK
jgi:hypothetical protein